IDNGLWQVVPDGRMSTTWRLKPGLKWHDGEPVTANDVAFTLDLYRDKEIGAVVIPSLALIDGVDQPDAQTAVINWQKPFIDADSYFGSSSPSAGAARVPPLWLMPRHILEQPFQDNKVAFFSLPY